MQLLLTQERTRRRINAGLPGKALAWLMEASGGAARAFSLPPIRRLQSSLEIIGSSLLTAPLSHSILCLCHLAWEETLFQRPQQLMRRMAERGWAADYLALWGMRRALKELRTGGFRRWSGLAEAGLAKAGLADAGMADAGVRYLHLPFFPGAGRFDICRRASLGILKSAALAAIRRRERIRRGRILSPAVQSIAQASSAISPSVLSARPKRVLWMYHPNFLSLADSIPHDLLVYDCMDHFAGFQAELKEISERERALASRADVVFTGGRTLYQSKKMHNPRTYCFPSGVEFDHFAKAASPETPLAPDLAPIAPPRLGYFGAVDERIDWALIREICASRPKWSVVFLGPLILYKECPIQAPNFHYLGPKPYSSLPNYLKGFDVCLMPFVQSELVAHISPTKTPEYLAGGRPVVSSPVPDVVADYAGEVGIAETPERFIACCESAIAAGVSAPRKPPASRTWDEIAASMEQIILKTLEKKLPGQKSTPGCLSHRITDLNDPLL